MRLAYFILLLMLIASCAQKIEIKNTAFGTAEAANIRTTKIEIGKGFEEVVEPKINIISPKDNEVINSSRIELRLNISNFKIVTPDKYPKKGQGHVQVWIDGMEFRGSKTEFEFENESNGTHVIKAELMLSNNTVLNYSKTIKIVVNDTS
ncbi:Ig-like domain-containing protein [Candidatus Woesearchaeota archaeon]|nr:Ig-like domain-containing protein [Candidatus Woesearchaeota archaeon]